MPCLPKPKPAWSAQPNEPLEAQNRASDEWFSFGPDWITLGTCLLRLPPRNATLRATSNTRLPATKPAVHSQAIKRIGAEQPHVLDLRSISPRSSRTNLLLAEE